VIRGLNEAESVIRHPGSRLGDWASFAAPPPVMVFRRHPLRGGRSAPDDPRQG